MLFEVNTKNTPFYLDTTLAVLTNLSNILEEFALYFVGNAKSNKFVNSTQKLEGNLVAAYDIIQGATFYLQLLHEIQICLKLARYLINKVKIIILLHML